MSAPDPHLIRTLEEILAHAREGRITSIAIALAGPETHAHSAEWHISGDDRELALIRTQLGGLCYDIAVHGSLARDLDIVAVPWTDEAESAERLIMHLVAAVHGSLRNSASKNEDGSWTHRPASVPTEKPHGRLAWKIHTGSDGLYIDVSVMPRAARGKKDGGT